MQQTHYNSSSFPPLLLMGRTLTATFTLSLAILVQLKIRVRREPANNILCSRIQTIHIMYSESLSEQHTQHSYTQADLAEVAIFATLVIHHPGPPCESSSGGPWLRAAASVARTTSHFKCPSSNDLSIAVDVVLNYARRCLFRSLLPCFLIATLSGNTQRRLNASVISPTGRREKKVVCSN